MTKLFVPFLLLSMFAYGQATIKQKLEINNPQTIGGWKNLNESNYSLQYPSTWELNHSGQMGTSFIILSPKESEQDKFRENVNLIIQDLTGKDIDLNKFTEISEGQIKIMVTNSILLESKRIKSESTEYQKIIYTGDQGIFHLKTEQYYWVVNNKSYILTFISEQDKFISFAEKGEKILNSFEIK